MKFKKLVSAVSALTVAAGCIGSMGITASAALDIATFNFDNNISTASDLSRMSTVSIIESYGSNTTKVLQLGGNTKGVALAKIPINGDDTVVNPSTGKKYLVEFDYTMDHRHTQVSLRSNLPTTSNARNYSNENRFFRIGSNNSSDGIIFSDGTDTKVGATNDWVHVKSVIDFTNKKMDNDVYTYNASGVYTGSGDLYTKDDVQFIDNDVNSIYGFDCYDPTNNDSNSYVDNIIIKELTPPTLTLSENNVVMDSENKATIGVSDLVGTISFEYEGTIDKDTISAAYNEGAINISYTGTQSTIITVIATNDGLTTSEKISVSPHNATEASVSVFYYETAEDSNGDKITTTTEIKPSITISSFEGATILASEIDTNVEDKDDRRYTFNGELSTDVSNGYVVKSQNDSIYLYYDVEYKTSYRIVAIDENGGEISVLQSNTGYVGDNVEYSYPKYINDSNGEIAYIASSENTFNGTYQITPDGVSKVEYKACDLGQSVFFENTDLAYSKSGVNESRNDLSGTSATRLVSNSYAYTNNWVAPDDATYQITICARNQRSGAEDASYTLSEMNDEGTITTITDTPIWSSPTSSYSIQSKEITMSKGAKLVIANNTQYNSNIYIDYVIVEKITTAPTASASFVKDYATDTTTDNVASLWKMTVTPGSEAITSVGVKATVNGEEKTGTVANTDTTVWGNGSALFAVVINKASEDIQSIKAVINGDDYAAYTQVVE